MANVITRRLGLQLSVQCKGTWGEDNVFKSEMHFHKQGRMQEIEPNDSQVHSHFGSCIHVKVLNI
jgi:hypothetical protein